jgi:hypothetical protein
MTSVSKARRWQELTSKVGAVVVSRLQRVVSPLVQCCGLRKRGAGEEPMPSRSKLLWMPLWPERPSWVCRAAAAKPPRTSRSVTCVRPLLLWVRLAGRFKAGPGDARPCAGGRLNLLHASGRRSLVPDPCESRSGRLAAAGRRRRAGALLCPDGGGTGARRGAYSVGRRESAALPRSASRPVWKSGDRARAHRRRLPALLCGRDRCGRWGAAGTAAAVLWRGLRLL